MASRLERKLTLISSDAARSDSAKLARADRFCERSAAVEVMQQFCGRYDW